METCYHKEQFSLGLFVGSIGLCYFIMCGDVIFDKIKEFKR